MLNNKIISGGKNILATAQTVLLSEMVAETISGLMTSLAFVTSAIMWRACERTTSSSLHKVVRSTHTMYSMSQTLTNETAEGKVHPIVR